MSIIEDGTGHGHKAKVDDDNRLEVASTARSIIVDHAHNGNAYVVYGKHALVAADTNEELMHMINDSEAKEIHIEKVFLSCAVGTGGEAFKIEMFFDAVHTSGGNARVPLNTRRSTNKSSIITVLDNTNDDLVCVYDPVKEFLDVRIGQGQSTFETDFAGAIILGPGDTLGMQVEGPNIGDKVRFMVFYYEEDAE